MTESAGYRWLQAPFQAYRAFGADPEDVKRFIRAAIYRRFGIHPDLEFVETHAGGGAAGIQLARYDALPQLIRRLQQATTVGDGQ